jgi:threonine dehydratase
MPISCIKKILNSPVYDVAVETPIDEMKRLGKVIGNRVLLKREDLQPVFSFKIRGAYCKIAILSDEEKARGVIAASAGNHAQGVALAASRLGIESTIVMPTTTPEIKVISVRELGGKVILHGDNFDEACAYATSLVDKKGYVFIHPYDDVDVIAGQGTIGMEIMRQYSGSLHAVFIPVGGGGLIAGVASYIKYLRPDIKIIGVEHDESACLFAAMKKGRRVVLPKVGIFADGVAVKQIGKEPFRLARQCVDEVITVSTDEICAAIKDIFDDTRSISEPAGALGLAGLKKYAAREKLKKETLMTIESGANVNFDRLRDISERAEVGEQREAIFAVIIPERPGSFKTFCKTIGMHNITEFNYRYSDPEQAHVFVGLELKPGRDDRHELIRRLEKRGYPVYDLTDNELAKMHIRHMVGGHASHVTNEVLYRFQFPERPGALLNFLTSMGQRWNISMFHYRNHGSAYGRVFLGLQVPDNEKKQLQECLKKLGHYYSEETGNPAYRLFLS